MPEHRCSRKGWFVIQCEMCPQAMHYLDSWKYVPKVCSEKCAEKKELGGSLFPRVEFPIFDSCEICGTCLFAGYNEPSRDKNVRLCNNCQASKDVAACLAEEKKKEKLSARLQENNLKNGRLVETECFLCGRKTITRSSTAKKLAFHYCDPTCGKIARAVKLSRKLLIYTPEFLRSLMEQDWVSCHFPGCNKPKAIPSKQNQFELCRLHAQRVYLALCARRQVRKRILEENG